MNLLDGAQEVTRFLFSKTDFSRPKKAGSPTLRIKPAAIAPMENNRGEWETSVMLTTDSLAPDVEALGKDHVAKQRNQDLVAYVSFLCRLVIEAKLKVDHDKDGHDKHAAIRGWPALKEEWLERASDLAEAITRDTSKKFTEL